MRLARHHLLPGSAPVVDEVAEAVVVVVDVGVRRAMMSHREQILDVADAPGRLADDHERRESDPLRVPTWKRLGPSPSFSKRWADCWDRSEESVEVSRADSDESASES